MTNETFVPARIDEIRQTAGEWIFVDIGFARRRNRSCGVAFNEQEPCEVPFGNLASTISDWIISRPGPFYLLIEAPLSVVFDVEGNPTGRTIERRTRGGKTITRYWYQSSGCHTLVAATHLLRELRCRLGARGFNEQVRLVEGFHSFKTKSSTHAEDVERLRSIVWKKGGPHDRIVRQDELSANTGDLLTSAFAVSGMNFGVPPVVEVVEEPCER